MNRLKKIIYLDSAEQFIQLYKNGTVTKANGTVITYDKNNQYMIASPTYYEQVAGVGIEEKKISLKDGTSALSEVEPTKFSIYDIENTAIREYKFDSISKEDATSSVILTFPEASGVIATTADLDNKYDKKDAIQIGDNYITVSGAYGTAVELHEYGLDLYSDSGVAGVTSNGVVITRPDGTMSIDFNGFSRSNTDIGYVRIELPEKSGTIATTDDVDSAKVKIVRLI